jgi:hypothetical protein
MGYVAKGDRMAVTYSVKCKQVRELKKLFFQMLDIMIPYSFLFLTLCDTKVKTEMNRANFSDYIPCNLSCCYVSCLALQCK